MVEHRSRIRCGWGRKLGRALLPLLMFACGSRSAVVGSTIDELPDAEGPVVASCAAALVACGSSGACVDPRWDPNHCGRCDHACGPSAHCALGECVDETADSAGLCENDELGCPNASGQIQCIAVESDPKNCGACGNLCPIGATCVAGDCRCAGQACCEAPRLSCLVADEKKCLDVASDNAHCGTCDNQCSEHQQCVAGACMGCSPTHFLLPVAFGTGPLMPDYSQPVATDLNQDGRLDLVIPDGVGSSLSLFYGDGAGQLGPRVQLTTVQNPIGVAVADMDGDGYVDIVSLGTGFLSVNWGAPVRPFDNWRNFAIHEDWNDTAPVALAVADLTTDGAPEAVVVTRSFSEPNALRVRVLSGFQDNTVTEEIVYEDTVLSHQPKRIQLLDLNGDHRTDIALLAHSVHALLNEGDGSFRFQEDWSGAPGRLSAQQLLDLNGDGRLDLASAEPYGQGTLLYGYYLRVALGNDSGGVDDWLPRPATAMTAAFVPNFAFADLNGDNFMDVVSRESETNRVYVELGSASGVFDEQSLVGSDVPGSRAGMALADLNADGRPDLIAAHSSASALTVHTGNMDTSFESYLLSLPEQTYLRSTIVLPRPGHAPAVVVVGGLDQGRLRVLSPDGSRQVSSSQDLEIYRPQSISRADVDGDGVDDAVVPAQGAVWWLRNLGAARFAKAVQLPVSFVPSKVEGADFDGDGRKELLLTPYGGGPVVAVLKADQQQGFSEFQFPIRSYVSTATGDIDGDAQADLVAVDRLTDGSNQARLEVWHGSRENLLKPASGASLPGPAALVQLVDLDGDGIRDVFVGHDSGYTAFRAGPNGTLELLAESELPAPSDGSLIVDIDLDGKPDLLSSTRGTKFELWRGLGQGRFELAENYLVPGATRVVDLGDFNGDGLADLLLSGGSAYDGSLLLLRGAVHCK